MCTYGTNTPYEDCPPFGKDNFQYRQLLQQHVDNAFCETLNIFHPRQREKVTISRTNLPQQGRNLQNLMVTAPSEAEDNVARAKLIGIKRLLKLSCPLEMSFEDSYRENSPHAQ